MSSALYLYEVDLVWVLSGWEDPIITEQYDTCQKSTHSTPKMAKAVVLWWQ